MLFFVVQIIAEDGEPLWCSVSGENVELVIGIAIGSIDDTEILRSIIAVFAMGINKDILAFARLTYLRHSLLKRPSYGFSVAIHPQRVLAIYKDAIVWRRFRGIELWWSVLNTTTKEYYRHDGQQEQMEYPFHLFCDFYIGHKYKTKAKQINVKVL